MASTEISIFAKPHSYSRRRRLPYPHLYRGSSLIRGQQIADYLGAKFNPVSGHENDKCIYVKPENLDIVRDGDWVDVVDGDHLIRWLQRRPGINVIANGRTSYRLYRPKLADNRMVSIPPHHCNFNRERRTRDEVTTVGYIGGEIVFHYPFEEIKKAINDIGLEFIWCCDYQTRKEVVDFYKKIDIQLVWARSRFRYQSRGPTKFINGASFGIPTVGFPQHCCKEVKCAYIKAYTIEEAINQIKELKNDKEYYRHWSRLTDWTEYYHISNIAEMYRQL